MKTNTWKKLIFGLGAFFSCFAIMLIFEITVRNPLTVVFFVLIFVELRRLDDRRAFDLIGKKGIILGSGISLIGGAAADLLRGRELMQSFDSGLFKLLTLVILFIGMSCLLFTGYMILASRYFLKDKNGSAPQRAEESSSKAILGLRGRKLFIFSAIVCFLCYLPYFLYEFPGIMTADSLVQYEQIIGVRPWSNHHPVVHTLLIKAFYSLGYRISGDAVTAISFYTVFQMIMVSLCGAEAVCLVDEMVGDRHGNVKLLALGFYAFIPFNAVFAVTLWKDVPFACITTMLFVTVIRMTQKDEKAQMTDWIRLSLWAISFCLFRSNAWFAFILWSIFVLIRFRKNLIRAAVAVLSVIIIVSVVKGPVFDAFSIERPDFTESLSVPLQQIAAVLVNDRDIPEEDMKLIEAVIDTTFIHELYAPDFADNIKELVRAGNPQVIEKNKGKYLGLWFRLLLRYPGDYVKAWFDLVGGYIYPDIPYKVGDVDGIMGNDMGLYWKPLIGGNAVVKTKEILIKMSDFVPLYGMLWCIGAYSWLLIIGFVMGLYRKREILGIVLLMLLIGTLLIASPVVDFRYAYGMIFSSPLWISSIFSDDKKQLD